MQRKLKKKKNMYNKCLIICNLSAKAADRIWFKLALNMDLNSIYLHKKNLLSILKTNPYFAEEISQIYDLNVLHNK